MEIQIKKLIHGLMMICHNTTYLVLLELKKNEYSESSFITKDKWIEIGIKAGAKKSNLSDIFDKCAIKNP